MKIEEYQREKAVKYAKQWAYSRNPKYYNYDKIGGDCTNYISQCIFAGADIMNYQKSIGWYYINANQKSPSWTGVEFLYKFLTTNKSVGPFGREVSRKDIEIGDIAQLSFDGKKFEHTLMIVNKIEKDNINQVYITSHTYDNFNKPITDYVYKKIRWIHIDKVRKW